MSLIKEGIEVKYKWERTNSISSRNSIKLFKIATVNITHRQALFDIEHSSSTNNIHDTVELISVISCWIFHQNCKRTLSWFVVFTWWSWKPNRKMFLFSRPYQRQLLAMIPGTELIYATVFIWLNNRLSQAFWLWSVGECFCVMEFSMFILGINHGMSGCRQQECSLRQRPFTSRLLSELLWQACCIMQSIFSKSTWVSLWHANVVVGLPRLPNNWEKIMKLLKALTSALPRIRNEYILLLISF